MYHSFKPEIGPAMSRAINHNHMEENDMTTITKDMSIGEVMNIDRTTAPILMEYGMHCFGCPFSQMESLEMGCAAHGQDVNELVEKLNDYLAKKE